MAGMAVTTGQCWHMVGHRLVQDYPYIEAEELQAIKEYARTSTDVVASRTRWVCHSVKS